MPITHYVSEVLGTALLLLTLPLVVELAMLTLASRLPQRNRRRLAVTSPPIRLAVIIPAHNEELGIGATIQGVRAQLQAGDRILVVADNCRERPTICRQG